MSKALFWVPVVLVLGACGGNMAGHAGHAGNGLDSRIVTSYGMKIQWHHLEEGKELAWLEEKPMLVDFHVPEGCPRCERMDRELYSRPEIARQINAQFVPVLIDLTRNLTRDELALGEKYEYNYECLLLFLNYRGEVVEDAGGGRMCFADFIDPPTFAKYLAQASAVASR